MKGGRLSVLIPLLLILSAATSSALLFWQEINAANSTIRQVGLNNLHTTLSQLQNMLNTQLAADSLEDARLSLSVSALNPGIRTLLLVDENNSVMLANRYIWEGGQAAKVSGYNNLIAQQVMRSQASSVSFDAGMLSGYYPVTLKIISGGLGINRIGVLYVEFDLAPQLAQARHNAEIQAFQVGGVMIAVAMAVAFMLHRLVSRRVQRIVEASQRFAVGDLDVRVNLRGRDELAELGRAFDDMARQRKDAQDEVMQLSLRNRLILDSTGEGIFGIGLDGRCTFANPAAAQLLGFTVDELLGQNSHALFHHTRQDGRPYPEEECLVEAVYKQGVLHRGSDLYWRKDGSSFPVELVCAPIFEAGQVTGAVVVFRDITERMRAEDALRLSSERLQLATRAANIGIWDWDVVKNELVWDDSMYQLYGIQRADFSGAYEAWIRTIHPEDKAHTDGEIQAALRGEREYAPEFRIVRPDGSIRFIKADSRTIQDSEGKPLRMIGTNIDITERKRILEAVQRSQSALEEAQRIAHIGSWDVDMVNDVLTWSDEIFRIWEIDKTQFAATFAAFLETVHPEDRDKVSQAYNQAIIDKSLYQVEHRLLFPDGRVKYIHERGEPYFDADGHPVRFIGTSLDISERKLAEAELLRYKEQLEETVEQRTAELLLARDAAEAANKAKSVFLANMSHELRTPLNAILGFSSLLRRDSQLTEIQRNNLDIINRSGEHLLTLINDVLEIAKIEAGRLQLEIAPFDLGSMVRDVVDMMQVRAQDKGLTLLLDQSSAFPRFIKGDEARLRQILVNLLGNAVKFTEQGGVVIRLGVKENSHDHLLIEVEDTGPGINPEDQQRIFQPFVQLVESGEQKGTGLGLTITRQFVQMMGGTISVESTLGEGTRFRVELPVEQAGSTDLMSPEQQARGEIVRLASGQPHYRVLIAEDQRDNQLLLSSLMTALGIEVKVAENGEQCIKLYQEWHPDLIWMDRRMPVMDGVEATRRIRQLADGDQVKIVAVTASAFKEQQQEILDVGMDDFVRKPYRFNEIYDCLARQLGVQYVYADGEPAAEPEAVPLTPEMLAVLPAELRRELRAALESLEEARISAVLGKVAPYDASLHKTLLKLAGNFDYPTILNVLQADSSEN